MTKAKSCKDNSHTVCTSSDSNLAVCVCWCAECKEYKRATARSYELSIKEAN